MRATGQRRPFRQTLLASDRHRSTLRRMAMEPIGVLGAGWVGTVTAACFAELGHEVVVRDVVPERVSELEQGRVAFHEPGLAELLERNRERLRFTLDVADVFSGPHRLRLRRNALHPLGRRRPLGGLTRSRRAARGREPRSSRDEEHGPGRNGRVDPERARRSRAGARDTSRTRSSSRRGRRSTTSRIRTGSSSGPSRRPTRMPWRLSTRRSTRRRGPTSRRRR